MAKTLKQKIEEVIEVEKINMQLKEKLKEFQEQHERNTVVCQD
jgi:hypothetical protein